MVIGCGVTVILHLGDVYYAGTPEEYEQHVSSFIRRLRVKTKKEILFYSIPGNHDYYSWGMPFLCFIKEINSEEFTKQKASYFCLRTEDGRWQFLGADTAYHDSNPLDQLNEANVGPRLRNRELAWHKEKLENFEGSTIFLTHHQLYSIHDRLCGSLSKYRHFSCINPVLSKQLFEYMPYFSAWYWGH
jgi:3',5'-cyclic AMP phosphodiesterase CpdA